MDKLKMHSPNLVDSNIEKISALFPNCITETKDENGELKKAVDFDLLKQELSQVLVEGEQERYRLDWVGKKESILLANSPIAKTLRPCREESVNFDSTENLFIEGDNLEALKLLQENYLGKVKMIYIDPPYNTGKDFIYEDDFAESTDAFLEKSNQVDDEGNRLVANTESNGRFHSDWLSMIYSRLKLARNILKDDGVIFVSIDDAELNNLMKILEEIFGRHNFVGTIVLQTATDNNPTQINTEHEYICVFSKNINLLNHWYGKSEAAEYIQEKYDQLKQKGLSIDNIQKQLRLWIKDNIDKLPRVSHYDNVDEKGVFHDGDIANTKFGGYFYNIEHPVTGRICKIPPKGFRYPETTLLKMIENNDVMFGSDETTLIKPKKRLENVKDMLRSIIYNDNRGTTKTLETLFFKGVFNNPKPHEILKKIISFVGTDNEIILDFFAGSSSTAHAVMQLNSEDHGKRKFIMVQLPEETDEKSESYKEGYKTIAEISKERIRRSGKKILEDNAGKEGIENLDIGFRVLKIDSTNMKDVYYTPDALKQADMLDLADHIKSDRTSEDLLFQVMLDWGLELSLPIERKTIAGKEVFYVAGNSLVACFDDLTFDVVDEVAKDHPLRFVSAEKAIHLDHDKTNIKERFKQLSPDTEVKFL